VASQIDVVAAMKSTTRTPVIVAVLLLLALLYIGSYFALVTPHRLWGMHGNSSYRIEAAGSPEIIFWPIEQLDRRLRPAAWKHPARLPVVG